MIWSNGAPPNRHPAEKFFGNLGALNNIPAVACASG
jgi:hypothetical protein